MIILGCDKKKGQNHATLYGQATITLCLLTLVVALSGCFHSVGIPEERYQRAEELVEQGIGLLREERLDDAEASFSMAYDLAPLAAALDGQGCVALLRGEMELAEGFFRKAYESDRTYGEALANLAILMDITGRHREAMQLYTSYLEQYPDGVRARNNRAALEYDMGGSKIWVPQELAKAALLSEDSVIRDNLTNLGRAPKAQ